MQITLNVPDGSDMANQIAGWQDGNSYEFTATQTAPNTFDVTEAEPAEAENESGESMATEGEGMMSEMPMSKNPAIARVMKGKE